MTAHIPGLLLSEFSYVFVAFLLVFLFPAFCFPIYLLRFTLKYAVRVWRSDLGDMLSPNRTLVAVDDIYNNPKAVNILYFVLEGEVSQDVTHRFLLKMVQRRNRQREFCYPELSQYIVSWFGFYFWKYEQDFDAREHVKIHNENLNEFHGSELADLASKWLTEPFPNHLSPWELLLIQNFKCQNDSKETQKSAVLIRFHESLADVFSFTKVLNDLFIENSEFSATSGKFHFMSLETLVQLIPFAMLLPYQMVKRAFKGTEMNELLHVRNGSNCMIYTIHPPIPVSHLKEIKEHFKLTSTTVVILASFAGTLRQIFLNRDLPVPSVMNLTFVCSPDGHWSGKLDNQVTMSTIGLPVGITAPVKRLMAVQDIYTNLLKDPTAIVTDNLNGLIGRLFHWMVKPVAENVISTSAIHARNLAGPSQQVKFSGLPCIEMGYFAGPMMRNAGIVFNSMTYMGNLRLTFGIQHEVLSALPKPDIENMASGFLKEVTALHKARAIALKRHKVL